MSTIRFLVVLSVLCPFLMGAWDHVLSPDAFFSVNTRVGYREATGNPKAYAGTTLMLAGVIAENTSSREGTTLEIDCYYRDSNDRPERVDETCGRFLARTSHTLAPERYARGRPVTLTGKLRGREVLPLGDGEYVYPVFDIGDIHAWVPKPKRRYRYYDCDPYWGRHYRRYYRFGVGYWH